MATAHSDNEFSTFSKILNKYFIKMIPGNFHQNRTHLLLFFVVAEIRTKIRKRFAEFSEKIDI